MNTQSIDQEILEKIEQQRLTMRSRRDLAVHRAWLIAAVVSCALFMVFLASFMLYALHRTGVLYLPLFGSRAIAYLLHPFSWFTGSLFFGGPVLVIIIGILIGRKARLYRMPLLYVWLILGTSFLAIGVLVFMSPLHGALQSRRLPVLGALYNAATCSTETNTATGIVRESSADGFKLVTLSKKMIPVRLVSSTIIERGYSVHDNDAVIVIGRMSQSVLIAELVHRSPPALSAEEERELRNIDLNESFFESR